MASRTTWAMASRWGFWRQAERIKSLVGHLDYFVVATSNTSDLSQSITFMDGTSKHIDNEMLFTDDNAVERTLNTLMNSEKSLYFIEYLN